MRKLAPFWIFFLVAMFGVLNQSEGKRRYFPQNNESKTLDMGSGCKIRMRLPKDAQVGVHLGSSNDPGKAGIGIQGLPTAAEIWGMDLQCYQSVEEYVTNGWATPKSGGWKLNVNEDTSSLIKLNALHFYDVHAVNSIGWAVAFDDTIGDEKFRRRTLAYCLIKNEKAVCGESQLGFLDLIKKDKRLNFTKDVLKILRETEFLDDGIQDTISRGQERGR